MPTRASAALVKNAPPKGENQGNKKLADSYYEQSKVMDDAAKKEDKTAAYAAFTKISTSYKASHKARKPS